MTTGNTILLLLAIASMFVYPPAFFVLGMIAAFNFIVKNLHDTRHQVDNPENPAESESSPTAITYHYLKKYRNQQPNRQILIPKIETADLTHTEKQTWDRIVNQLNKDN